MSVNAPTNTHTCSHAPVDFQDLWMTSSLLCFSLSCVAKIGELVVSPCLGAFCFSAAGCHVYLEPLAPLFFLYKEKNMSAP